MLPSETDTTEILTDLGRRRRREAAKLRARSPRAIRDVVAETMLRHGYGRIQAGEELAKIWQEIVGENYAKHCRPGQVRRGVLEVLVTHSVFVQELTNEKRAILAKLASDVPQMKVRDLRFRTGLL